MILTYDKVSDRVWNLVVNQVLGPIDETGISRFSQQVKDQVKDQVKERFGR